MVLSNNSSSNFNNQWLNVPSGPVVKNLSVSAGVTSLILGLGRFHMLRATKFVCLRAGALQLEKAPQ